MLVSGVQFRQLSGVVLATLALVSVQANVALAQDAQSIYVQRYAPCHGANGKGDGPAGKMLNPPSKDFATALNGKGNDWIAQVITEGGPAVGLSAAMPSTSGLSDEQPKDLVRYVKTLGS